VGWSCRKQSFVWTLLCLACSSGGGTSGTGESTSGIGESTSGIGESTSGIGGTTGLADGDTGSQPDPEPSGVPPECRSPCELAGSCAEEAEFPDQAATLEAWLAQCGEVSSLVGGTCSDEKQWLFLAGGYTSEVRYFDGSGDFIGLGTTTDVLDETCAGRGYYPEPIRCSEAVVTEVHCGNDYAVGDSLDFPWSGE